MDIGQFDWVPNTKHAWSSDRLLENDNVLKTGTGKNPTTALYIGATSPENVFNLKKTIKSCENNKMITCLERLCKYL